MAILKIFSSNISNAAFAFLATFLVASFATVEVYASYAKIINYGLIFTVLFELGISVFIVVYSDFRNYIFRVTIIYLLSMVLLTIVVVLYYGMTNLTAGLLLGAVMGCFKLITSYHQACGSWNKYSISNSVFSFSRVASVTLVFAFFVVNDETVSIESLITVTLFISLLALWLLYLCSFDEGERRVRPKTVIASPIKISWLIKKVSPYCWSAVIITLAMRIDIAIADWLLTDVELASYSIAIQIAFVLPLIANSLLSYYLKDNINIKFSLPKIIKKFFICQIAALSIVYILFNILESFVFFGKYPQFDVVGYILVFSFCGGIIFTPYEAKIYNENPRVILKMKICQLVSIVGISTFSTITYGMIGLAFGVLISRIFGWIFIYAFYSNWIFNEKIKATD
ncbi:hypothetical protein IFO68_17185 [Photobacterium sp. CAU 1568]|uniref:Polysaccharide biosynthesis protein n=1 Tax=Photobacterium arenosum TaxID=2774143 RepID=A0ABR9BS37_9GAMM|nr:hypothetical protein [Photobacterium arenosum]MBD8514417.1 hypothetical protein [Photobacterium arenosum]